MALPFLRPDLPASYAFSVTEQPHTAKLDQNEAPVDLPAELKRELLERLAAREWNRYVQPAEYAAAKRGLAACFDLDPNAIAITVGADQAIEAAFLVAGGPGRSARWFEPTYPYFGHAARRTFTRAAPADLATPVAPPAVDLIAFVSPNNPTGELVSAETIDAALAEPARMVAIDEAYADFSGVTSLGKLAEHDNLFIIRSLSKSSLAAVHLGFVAAHPDVVAIVERLYTAPYHLNHLQLLLAERYGDIAPHVAAIAADVIAERTRVASALVAADGITPLPSHANFIMFRVAGAPDNAKTLHARLAALGIRIRDVGGLSGLAGHLRVTIGTREQNDQFLAALRD